ncbi:VIR protein [Plasmodium vivax]|uniref:VIR protein n=1 Tax=Plasmodium vivax TaxID=5855 RepID=A0A1G4E7V9_PLAVI|nr:VIR protein [Plasmodium vivax]VUZ99337.1 PIR protein [Plasmodium vivax]
MSGGNDRLKEQYFTKFDKDKGINDNDVQDILDEHTTTDNILQNWGRLLAKNFIDTYYECEIRDYDFPFDYLNEWINNKKNVYLSTENDCSKIDLWDNYIEKLWKKLEESRENCKRCTRSTTKYICDNNTAFPQSDQQISTPSSKASGTTIFVSLLGASTTLFIILYKFTPFRAWLRRQINKCKELKKSKSKDKISNLVKYSEKNQENVDNTIFYHSLYR